MKLLIVSDIRGNWAALETVLNAESDADRILCLGDPVGYGPEPVACVNWAIQRAEESIFVQGNHDWGVAWRKDPRSSPPYRQLAESTQAFCLSILSEEMLHFLRLLQPISRFELGNRRCLACHAAPSEPLFRYLRTTDEELQREIEITFSPHFLFFGHTHWPFLKRIGSTIVVNPGSVGQPKDGDPSAAYAVWEEGEVKLRRISYPIEDTIRAYARSTLSSSDIECLTTVLRTGGTLRPVPQQQ